MNIQLNERQFLDALLYSSKFNKKDFQLLCSFYNSPKHCISLDSVKELFNDQLEITSLKRLGSIGRKILDYHKIDVYADVSRYRINYYDFYCIKKIKSNGCICWTLNTEMITALDKLRSLITQTDNSSFMSLNARHRFTSIRNRA